MFSTEWISFIKDEFPVNGEGIIITRVQDSALALLSHLLCK